jgi:hypothetical protein
VLKLGICEVSSELTELSSTRCERGKTGGRENQVHLSARRESKLPNLRNLTFSMMQLWS